MIDLSKLTPAPWSGVGPIECDATNGDYPLNHRYMLACGNTVLVLATFSSEHDCDFAALARNALEVMTRRRWTPQPLADGAWSVQDRHGGWPHELLGFQPINKVWDNPFSALVETDAYVREHVEKTT